MSRIAGNRSVPASVLGAAVLSAALLLSVAAAEWLRPTESASAQEKSAAKTAPKNDAKKAANKTGKGGAAKPNLDPNDPDAAAKALSNPSGLSVTVWANRPHVQNPVAISFDRSGRLYIAETYRWKSSTYDIRGYQKWWDDDLLCRTVADRDAMHRKWMGDKADKLTDSELVRLTWDSDGDGRADKSEVFADNMATLADGLNSGVLAAENGDVYVANIPNLWLFRDSNGDGKTDVRKVLHHGYGVRLAFLGHDLHGLIFGPDGKLYFSLGDRGVHIDARDTPDGRAISNPDHGCVMRCNPDGTGLEIIHVGLRNPQELAFDEWGNLFTCDNNCDNGDKARWVYLAEGGDTGWRIGYQRLGKSGPWITERLWELPQENGYYRLPALAHVSHGPSGLAYNPGVTALPTKYDRTFFLCNCPGNLLAITLQPKGAGWSVDNVATVVDKFWPSDVTFGPDGALYVSNWGSTWEKNGPSAVYRLTDPATAEARKAELDSVRKLIAEGCEGKSVAELIARLSHADMRIRQSAQFALVRLGKEAVEPLSRRIGPAAGKPNPDPADALARLHAAWALGQIARVEPKAVAAITVLLGDPNENLRAAAAKLLGDARHGDSTKTLIGLLRDGSGRVRYEAAVALGKLGDRSAVEPVLAMLRENADADALLRHAGVMALSGLAPVDVLATLGRDQNRSVRLAALLTMRRLARPEIAMFLADADPALVYEAVRAIHDAPIAGAEPALARLATADKLDEKWLTRIVNANYRLGTTESATALARLAGRGDLPEAARVDAFAALAAWEKPRQLDRVLNMSRPLPASRDAKPARDAVRLALAGLGAKASGRLKGEATKAAAALGLKEATADLAALVANAEIEPAVRAEALATLAEQKDAPLVAAVTAALADSAEPVRAQAARLVNRAGLPDPLARLTGLLGDKSMLVRQAAIAGLGESSDAAADAAVAKLLGELTDGRLPAALQLDVLEAAGRKSSPTVKAALAAAEAKRNPADPLGKYRECLEGGDAVAGRRLFYENAALGCFKCHAINGEGGVVGPALSKIGKEKPRDYLLESIVTPNKQIAKGFEQVIILTDEDVTETGRIEKETPTELVLIRADGSRKNIAKSAIAARKVGQSAMPEDIIKHLSRRDLRDVIEYLSTLREEKTLGHGAGN